MSPIAAVLEARRLGVQLWLEGDGDECRVRRSGGDSETVAWLRRIRDEDETAFGLAVAIVAAVVRSGGDPEALRAVRSIEIRATQ